MAFDTIRYDDRDGWVHLTLNRPDVLNALDAPMHDELAAALGQVRGDGARALVLSGAGRGFCAGQDLRDPTFPTGEGADLGAILESRYNPLVRTLGELPLPTIAAVHGVAADAGANLALACDLVLAGRGARFVQSFARLGLIPDTGGTWTLTRRVGEARALGLALTGEPVTGEEAAAWGLIWKAVDDDAVLEAAEALAVRLAAGPTRAFALTKRAIRAAAVNDLDAQLGREADLQREAGHGEDFREGVRAVLDEREPVFKGR
ncbi:MAG: 2-(1,2-epoxy-1,2-dihydrophenyl)acetyl-CoA isomerase [Alphaproteobacteria bacterium]|nr:2-(1,2-epoxy-1,2-dihydrophenyl)acetyl-CoA isomerase [Alphaproteobacteria bacterium]